MSLVLVAMVVIAYAPVRRHDFVNLDDPQYVSENPHVAGGLTWPGVAWTLTARHAGNWHPLTWLSHMLDVQLLGTNAGAHHLTSVLLHIVNSLLLFGLLRRMTGALWRSAFVAALFAVHPLHVESVAWVAERKDVLSTLFGVLTLWAYFEYVRKPRPAGYAAVLTLFALGLMAKPMLVTLPFLLLLLDHWPLGRVPQRSSRQLLLEKLPLFALSLASSVVTFAVQQHGGAVKGLDVLPLGQRLANALVAYVGYISQMLWPAGLAALYPYRPIPGWQAAGAFVVLAAVSVVATRAARRHPYLPVGWFWYLGTLVPVIGLVQVGSQPMADRYTYVPLVGLFIMLAWGIPELLASWRHRSLLPAAAGFVVLACAIAAREQVRHWKDSLSLWEHALQVTTENYRAHQNLGHILTKQGRPTEAIPHYSEALRIKPDSAEAHNNLGHALADQGRAAEAIAHYSEAVRLVPDFEEAHNNLGVALVGQGKTDEAIGHLTEALRIKPGLAVTHNNLGVALAAQAKIDEAARHFSEALRIKPNYADAHKNLALTHSARGTALAEQGKVDEAIGELREALRMKPDEPDFHYDLAVLFFRKGRTSDAIRHFETALTLDPGHQSARRALDALGPQGRAVGAR